MLSCRAPIALPRAGGPDALTRFRVTLESRPGLPLTNWKIQPPGQGGQKWGKPRHWQWNQCRTVYALYPIATTARPLKQERLRAHHPRTR